MTSNLKLLGLALMAALALTGTLASSAWAQAGMLISDGPVTLTGTETAGENKFEMFGVAIECPGSTYAGHKVATTPHALIPNGATEATITPKFVNCKVGKNPGKIEMNGCDFVFRDPKTTGLVANTFGITMDIVCPMDAEILIEGGLCILTVPPQVGLLGLHMTGTPAADDIDLIGSITNVEADSCFKHTENAVIKADWTIKGHSSTGANTGVTIADLAFG